MALFDNFPYTNFHNLNLDWIIKVLKEATAELEDIQTNWESVRETANEANEHATMAQYQADDAKKIANSATTAANEAKTLAQLAAGSASSANEIANAANVAATEAAKTAGIANDNALNAVEKSTNAESTANGFSSRITAAEENATEAKNTAGEANQNSKAALVEIDTVSKSVNSIGDVAQQALDLATTNEGDIASLDADVAQLNSAILSRPTKYIGNSLHSSLYINSDVDADRIISVNADYTEDNYDTELFDYVSWAKSLTDYDIDISFTITYHTVAGVAVTGSAFLMPIGAALTENAVKPQSNWIFYFARSGWFQYSGYDGDKGLEFTPIISLRYRGVKKNN